MMKRSRRQASQPPFRLLLLKPSKYDDDGYVIRYWRSVLPSNTLAALYGLTQQALDDGALPAGARVEISMLDETAHKIDPLQIARRMKRGGARAVVCLAGVQTNQFPRAADLARQFRELGLTVLIGGFHVSGAIAMSDSMPPEVQALMDDGVTVVKGEVEDAWGGILRDLYEGRHKIYYDIIDRPDLEMAAIPTTDVKYWKKFAYPNMGTIDAGRGCPFNCSFCTIINVQGRKMRCRSAEKIKEAIRANYSNGVNYYFFTDDNFARNQNWEPIFDALIDLREKEGLNVTFMMQVDTISYKIKNFAEKAGRAGCSQVFIGLEAVRASNLDAAGKKQNKAVDYHEMVRAWRDAGIVIHTGYIIGFPDDTPQTVAEDIDFIKNDLKIDQASFFMLTPLPGSRDHVEAVKAGVPMDPDYNKFDSFHAVTPHPRMSGEEWYQTYLDAWNSFYSFDHMKECLLNANERTYWGLFKNYIWYKSSVFETTHPMICGFFRMKDRTLRRPGFPVDGRLKHARMRTREIGRRLAQWTRDYFEMQELWLQTRPGHGKMTAHVNELRQGLASMLDRASQEAGRLHAAAGETMQVARAQARQSRQDWLRQLARVRGRLEQLSRRAAREAQRARTVAGEKITALRDTAMRGIDIVRQLDELQRSLTRLAENALRESRRAQDAATAKLAALKELATRSLESLRESLQSLPGVNALPGAAERLRFWSTRHIYSRAGLDRYWAATLEKLRRGRIYAINPFTLSWNFLRDVKLQMAFAFNLASARTR